MSTISPVVTQRIAHQLAQRGVAMLDAPVSGGDKGAIAGTLSIMVGGNEAVFSHCLPVFQALGKTIVYVGESGSGQVVKACNQVVVALTIGAGLLAFLHATLRPGAEIVLDAVQLAQRLEGANLVITAEGQIDEQTAYGKSVAAVARLAKRDNIPVLALAGSLRGHYQSVYELGVDALITLPSYPMTLAYAMENAATLTSDAIERALRILVLGSRISFLP